MKTLFASILALLVASTAHAELVTVRFEAVITELNNDGVDVGSQFSVGQRLTGTFTYDDTTPNADATVNSGSFADAFTGLTLNVGGYTAGIGTGNSLILTGNDVGVGDDNADADIFFAFITAPAADPVDGAPVDAVSWSLVDTDKTVYADDAAANSLSPAYDFAGFDLPNPQRSGFTLAYQEVIGFDPIEDEDITRTGSVRANLSRVAVVPEPGSLALLGLSGLIVTRRRRS